MLTTRAKWRRAEQCIIDFYRKAWRKIIATNFTIRGGELDVVGERWSERVFIEVKDVSSRDDVLDFIPATKMHVLQRSIAHFMQRFPTDKQISLDMAYVYQGKLLAQFTNVTFYE